MEPYVTEGRQTERSSGIIHECVGQQYYSESIDSN